MPRAVLFVLMLSSAVSFPVYAQQWSPAQQEVWQSVEDYWHLYASEDLEGFLGFLHEDFSGWTHTSALPRDKEDMARYLPRGFANTETVLYDIDPVGIKVHGDFAIAHYYYTRTFTDAAGVERNDAGRWTDILLKQGDRWVMIADHGGSDSGG